jgi:hypothetical protein
MANKIAFRWRRSRRDNGDDLPGARLILSQIQRQSLYLGRDRRIIGPQPSGTNETQIEHKPA